MLKFTSAAYTAAVTQITIAQTLLINLKDGKTPTWVPTDPVPSTGNVRHALAQFQQSVTELEARFTLASVNRLLADIDAGKCITRDLQGRLRAVMERLYDELEQIQLYVVSSDYAKYLEDNPAPFGDEVAESFPTSSYDVVEATKCLGLRRSTACVMHLMRSLETPLSLMAKTFGVASDHTNWHTILDQIEARVKGMNEPANGPNWRDQQKFFAGAASHFRFLKDGWRNHAMHQREKYTEGQAQEIYDGTKAFMRQLSLQLSEPRSLSRQ